jgi:hypothetical protein
MGSFDDLSFILMLKVDWSAKHANFVPLIIKGGIVHGFFTD